MDEIFIDLNFLTPSERDLLQDVLARDDAFRREEKRRLSVLKGELELAKKSNAIKAYEKTSTPPGKVCARCHESFGVIFNTGAFCPKCKAKVCKNCRQVIKNVWLCVLCAKVRDVKAKSGAWFYDQVKTKNEARMLFGTSLIRASLKRRKTSSSSEHNDDIPNPPVIGLHHGSHDRLHRPIPVHMSAIREREHRDNKEENDEERMNEVNRNYKPFAKAIPVKKNIHSSLSDREETGSEEDSRSSTPTADYDNDEVIVTRKDLSKEDKERDEAAVFDFLDDIHQGMTSTNGDQEEFRSFDANTVHHTPDTSLEFHSLPMDTEQTEHTPKSRDHLRVAMTSERSTSIGSVDSYRTANYGTPSETPHSSDFNTPTQSLPASDDESNFMDARDTTPVPSGDFHSLPQEVYPPEPNSTPTQEAHQQSPPQRAHPKSPPQEAHPHSSPQEAHPHSSPQEAHQQSPPQRAHYDIVPPEIVTTAVDDMDGPSDSNEPQEDIDQAFATYGSLSNKSLSLDQFEMGSRESIVSYYSDAGEGHYGNIPITGEVQLGLKYDYRGRKLEVQIHRARDLAPVDTKKNRSDPYVKVYLLPDKTKGGKRKTRTKKHTLNPEFDEILTFKLGFDEMVTRSLWVSVWNHDRFGHNDFLGEIIFPLDSYEQSGFSWDYPSAEWYPLKERRSEPSLMQYCGELVVALKYVPPEVKQEKKGKKKKTKGDLYVAMVEAHNLPPKDSNGFSDPFCKSYLLPDKSKKTKRKTTTIKKNLNPVWKHTIVYENLTTEELMDRVLELTVWDWDRGLSNTFLGGVRLGMGARQEEWDDAEGDEIEAWQVMMDKPNEWNRFTLTLRSFSRFQQKQTDSESEASAAHIEEQKIDTKPPTEQSKLNQRSSSEEGKGIVNMAYSQSHGDKEEERDMGSIFKSFNNFTNRFKFTNDKIDETKPADANYGTFGENCTKISDEGPKQTEKSPSPTKEGTEDQNDRNAINKPSTITTDESRQHPKKSEVPTIVAEPQPSAPEKSSTKDGTDGHIEDRFKRRSTDNILFFEGATLSPDLDLRRRHSTDVVSVPQPLNEELVMEDMKKRGSPFKRRSTKKKQLQGNNK